MCRVIYCRWRRHALFTHFGSNFLTCNTKAYIVDFMKHFEIGEKISLPVVAISGDAIFLDLNAKSEGILDAAEFTDEAGVCTVKEGDVLEVYFIGNENGEMEFTAKISGSKVDASILEHAYKNSIPVEGHVAREIKGGYEVTIGTNRAFCPYSQMGFKQKGERDSFVGQHLTFKIQEYKNDGRDMLVSNRAILEEAHNRARHALKETIQEGMVVDATVMSLQKYGAFVDIGEFEALLPISEISRARIDDVSNALHIGQHVKVKIIKTDWEHERVSVSMKALLADPWDSVAEKYHVGQKYEGTISRIAAYGVFIALEDGIEGLVHVSELEGVDRNSNLAKIFTKGAKMPVIIKEVDAAERRISLAPTTSIEQDKTTAKYIASQNADESYNPFAILLKK